MVRLFGTEVASDRKQPVLLQGEVERGSLAKADLVFDGVGGVEGHLSDEYKGGYTVLTNLRIIWVAFQPDGTPFSGIPCHLPLGAIAECDLHTSLLSFKAPKMVLNVRVNAQGYPVSDAMQVSRVSRIKIVSKAGKMDTWHSMLRSALDRRAWESLPPPVQQILHSSPARVPRQQPGPMTPPRVKLQTPDPAIVRQLKEMGFEDPGVSRAALATGNADVDQALDWLLQHPDGGGGGAGGVDASTPGNDGGQYGAYPIRTPPSNAATAPGVEMSLSTSGGNGTGRQPHRQGSTTGPAVLHTVGVGGILHREQQRVAATDRSMAEALQDLEQLMAKAGEMAELAKYFRRRIGASDQQQQQGNGDEQLDAATAQELEALGLAGTVTKESAGELYHQELARQLAQVLKGPVERAGGMMPLPDAYCLFNRARFTDLVSPDDLLKAVKLLPAVHAPLRLVEFPSGVKVIQLSAVDEDSIAKKLAELAIKGVAKQPTTATDDPSVSDPAGAHMPWASVIGPGITRLEVAAALKVPLPVAAEHLSAAEARGLLCRDEGPEGLRFYKNFFRDVSVQ